MLRSANLDQLVLHFFNCIICCCTLLLQYTSFKPLGDKVLVKTETDEEKTDGSILLPANLQPKPQRGVVVAVSERKATGNTEGDCPVTVDKGFSPCTIPLND